ncbi:50S ribosomal protein L30 [Aeromicrobium sp.]|uniref:50S ribosomal protein L30 n=1 Tax=Aeromicrobium sp. TaxID=1871063 RepID=UPI003D6B4643
MTKLQVTQIKSGIGRHQNQRHTLRSLGLKRIGDVVVKDDRPEIRGMVASIPHLVDVKTLPDEEAN